VAKSLYMPRTYAMQLSKTGMFCDVVALRWESFTVRED
jgi:hypothetical protein